MQTITFYSYKGGAGRSLALANAARYLARLGFTVVALDFDLEAPGLHYKFSDSQDGEPLSVGAGVVDYIYSFLQEGKLPRSIGEFLVDVAVPDVAGPLVRLIPAGTAPSADYWSKLSRINWHELFYSRDPKGVELFLELKGRISDELCPDFLLIDSRTGITEMGGVATILLADRVICLVLPTGENVKGARAVLRSLRRSRRENGAKEVAVTLALSRLPEMDDSTEHKEAERILAIMNEEAEDLQDTLSCPEVFILHSEAQLQVRETLRVGRASPSESVLLRDYLKLFDIMLPEGVIEPRVEQLRLHARDKIRSGPGVGISVARVPADRIAAHSNSIVGENGLMSVVPGHIETYLDEITTSDQLLRHAYVSERHPAQDGGVMDLSDPGEYGSNVFSERLKDGTWRTIGPLSRSAARMRLVVSDPAELHLVDRILWLADGLTPQIDATRLLRAMGQAPSRLFFVQGGIGCGKSTMLHHLIRLTLPDLHSRGLLPFALPIALSDLNTRVVEGELIQPIWKKVLGEFMAQIGQQTGLNTPKGWEDIARDDIYDREGRFLPEIEFSSAREELIKKIIHDSEDPATFLRRVGRHLCKETSPSPMTLVLDNLDRVPDVRAQRLFAEHLLGLLEDIPNAVGIIAVREYTLGAMEQAGRQFAGFYHVNRLHLTTPFVGDVLRRRIEGAIKRIDEEKAPDTPIEISRNVTVSLADCRALLNHIVDAFEPETFDARESPRDLPTADMNDGMQRLSVFLYNVTNLNIRAALQIVSAALRSWALTQDRFVVEYLGQKASHRPISLSPFTVDELVRLASCGPWLCYDSDLCFFFHNVFATDSQIPERDRGRVPLLHVYRILQYCDRRGLATPRQVLADLECLAYDKNENLSFLQTLLERGFLESRAGLGIEEDTALFATRRLHFYLRRFTRSLVYLSMVRNDCHLEYAARPWDFNDSLSENCTEGLKFIWYVLDQEAVQYWYAKSVDRADAFRRLAGGWPVGWRLVQSVRSFLTSVGALDGGIPRPQWDELQSQVSELEALVLKLAKEDTIYGQIDLLT